MTPGPVSASRSTVAAAPTAITQFATDLAAATRPNYSKIVSNLCDDGHDCLLVTADGGLQTDIGPPAATAPAMTEFFNP